MVYIHRYAGLNSPCKWFIVIGIFTICKATWKFLTAILCSITNTSCTEQKNSRKSPASSTIGWSVALLSTIWVETTVQLSRNPPVGREIGGLVCGNMSGMSRTFAGICQSMMSYCFINAIRSLANLIEPEALLSALPCFSSA